MQQTNPHFRVARIRATPLLVVRQASDLSKSTSSRLALWFAAFGLLFWLEISLAASRSPAALADLVDEYRSSDPPLALEYAEAALRMLDESPDPALRIRVMAEMVWALRRMGRYSDALALGMQAQVLAETIGDAQGLGRTLNNIGIVYWYLGDHESALDTWVRALAIREEAGDMLGVAGSLNNIGLVYADLGEYESAVHHFERALDISETEGNLVYQANHLDNLGEVYAATGNVDRAQEYYQQALAVARDAEDHKAEISILVNLGTLMLEAHSDTLADQYLTQGHMLAVAIGDGSKQAEAGLRLAELAMRRGTPEKALEQAYSALTIAQERGDKQLTRDLSRVISEIQVARGDYALALKAYQDYSERQEDLLKRQRDDRITLLQIQFEAASREQEINRLTEENALRQAALTQAQTIRRLMLFALALLVALVGFLILAYRNKHRTSELIGRQNDQLEANRVELLRLASSDPLTGLMNRRAITEKMDDVVSNPDTSARRFATCLLDLDSFKTVNDELGHDAGDAVLVEVANRLRQAVPDQHYVSRWGGEEFLVFMAKTDLARAEMVAEDIRRCLESEPLDYRGYAIPIAASFGVSEYVEGGRSVQQTLRTADKALYMAKRLGGNRVCSENDLAIAS